MSTSHSRAGTRAVTWRYALVGGLLSIPLTGGFYWLSGMGNSLSLNMVFVGGLVAGYLAKIQPTQVEPTAVGLRAGVIGGLPALWILGRVITAAQALTGPVWFRTVALAGVLITTGVLIALAAVVGALGARVGAWLAQTLASHPSPVADP